MHVYVVGVQCLANPRHIVCRSRNVFLKVRSEREEQHVHTHKESDESNYYKISHLNKRFIKVFLKVFKQLRAHENCLTWYLGRLVCLRDPENSGGSGQI